MFHWLESEKEIGGGEELLFVQQTKRQKEMRRKRVFELFNKYVNGDLM